MIAIALAAEPDVLIADEPTTALDVTVQKQILDLLLDLQQANGMAMLLITHDLGIVSQVAHRIALMYAGQIVEVAETAEFFARPLHPYARMLLDALPDTAKRGQAAGGDRRNRAAARPEPSIAAASPTVALRCGRTASRTRRRCTCRSMAMPFAACCTGAD